MKKLILIMSAIMIATFPACSQEKHEHHDKKESHNINKISDSPAEIASSKSPTSIKEIVDNYLVLKNALAADNSKDAAAAGKTLEASFKKFDKKELTEAQKKVYADVEDDAREHAEHIGANGGNIEHQREHFVMLSKDIYDLVKAVGSEQVLYKDFCGMYGKKGAFWLSETKEIKNPYHGRKMLTCGSVKEEIK